MNKLEEALLLQKEFESLFVNFERIEQGDSEYLDKVADYLSTALAKEAFEFRDEFNWKMLAKLRLHNRDKQIEEAIDCFTFSLNLLLILGLDADQVFEWYKIKNVINWERQADAGNQIAIDWLTSRSKHSNMEM